MKPLATPPAAEAERMMKRLQGGLGIGAHRWLRGTVLLLAGTLAAQAGLAQSIRLVPSTVRFAGSPPSGPQGGTNQDSGKAASTRISGPTYVTSDVNGNVYIADAGNNCIRRVDTSGNMTVAVGQPTGGDDTCQNPGSVTAADYTTGVLNPSGVALDASGNLFVADTGHNCVRRLTTSGIGIAGTQPLIGTCADNTLTSVAPTPAGLAVDASGNLYVAINDPTDGIYQVLRSSPSNYSAVCLLSGSPSTAVSTQCAGTTATPGLKAPQGLTIDPVGNLYIADSGNSCVREVSSAGVPTTAVGSCTGGATTTPLQTPVSVAADAAGHLYVNDNAAGEVFELLNGQLTQVAGDGQTGPYDVTQEGKAAVTVALSNPEGLATDKAGNVYLADTANNIVRVLQQGLRFSETQVGNPSTPQSLWFQILNAVNLSTSIGGDFPTFSNQCNGAFSAPAAGKVKTCQIALQFRPKLPGLRTAALTLTDSVAPSSNIYRFGLSGVGQSAEAIFIPGTINTLAASLASPSAIAIDSMGDVYYAESGSGSGNGTVSVLPSGSATPTRLIAAGGGVATPTALALDTAGNLYIADSTTNSVLRYDANGNLSTVVGGLDNPVALVVDPLGDIYVAEDGATTVGVLEIYAGGQQSIIAGQGTNSTPDNVLATTAKFIHPSALYLDPTGVLYVADRGAYRVYQIDTAGGSIRYFAGNGTTTDSAPGTRLGAGLGGVTGLSADAAGDVYIADAATSQVFLAFSGAAQNPSIEVLAGTGTAGSTGDNGPANKAELNNPAAVAVDGAANVYIADNGNSSLREITYQDPTLDFGVVKVGQTSAPMSATLWNAGNGILQPLATMFLDDTTNFAIDTAGSGCGNSISPGATCNLSFVFMPQAPGSYVAHSTLTDSSVNPTQVITLIGEAPKTTLTAPNVTAVYGDAYTLNASVTGNLTTAPTGDVTFLFNGTPLCPPQPLPANGQVSCTPPNKPLLDVGVYPITVTYTGDSIYDGATVTMTLTITPRPVTITADNKTRAINTANPPLTGIVSNATVPGQSITATYSTTATISSPAGAYPIVPAAVLGPGVNPADYTIILVNGTLTITGQTAGATVSAPNVTVVYGGAYTLNASVTGTLTPGPTGTVTFLSNGTPLCPPLPLPANGQVSCMPSNSPLLDVGKYPITVTYSGDSTYVGSTAATTLTITPRPVTITADNKTRPVNTANPPLTGTVANAVVPGQAITATYSTTATTSSAVGAYPIVPAAVLGSGVNPADYSIVLVNGTLTVTSDSGGVGTGGGGGGGGGTGGGSTGSFTLASGPGEQEIDHSGTINYSVSLASTGGFTGPIALACSGLPEGATCSFSPASVTLASGAQGASTMTITATADNSNVPTIFGKVDTTPGLPAGSNFPVLAWTMLPLGLGGSAGTLLFGAAGRRRRKLLLLLPFALLLAIGMSGCASPSNYKIYTVTVTATATSSGATITKSSTVDMVLAR